MLPTPDHPFWADGVVQTLVFVVALLAVVAGIRHAVPMLKRLGMPDALLAGALALGLGPSALGLLPFDAKVLESVVYHGLALVYVAVSLQSPPQRRKRDKDSPVRSFAFAIPVLAVMQGFLGLFTVLVWNWLVGPLHIGVGMMLPLGFNQGPGAALSLGTGWEQTAGLESGGQIGLIMAAMGYGWCIFAGVGLVAYARRVGWADAPGRGATAADRVAGPATEPPVARRATPGGLEPLSAQIVAIACVYAATLGFLWLLTSFVPPKAGNILWSFHFILASGFALLARGLIRFLHLESPLDDDLLARTSSTLVDVTTASALAAVQIAVLWQFLTPVLVISSVGGSATLLVCVWLARRAFPQAPFQHATVLFGALTGTATTGLALLRMLDPDLRGNVARNYVYAATGAAMLALPLFALMPIPVEGYGAGDFPRTTLVTLGILVLYLGILVFAWWRFAALRFTRPAFSLWPPLSSDSSSS